MAPRLSGQTSKFGVVFFVSKSPLGIVRQKKLYKFAILTRKPRIHVRILIYRTWPIAHGPEIGNIFTNTCRPSKETCSPRSQRTLSEKKAERESLL